MTRRADELYHFGVKGMKWGVRRFQNKDGSLTPKGKAHNNVYKRLGESANKTSVGRSLQTSGKFLAKSKVGKIGLKIGKQARKQKELMDAYNKTPESKLLRENLRKERIRAAKKAAAYAVASGIAMRAGGASAKNSLRIGAHVGLAYAGQYGVHEAIRANARHRALGKYMRDRDKKRK